MFTKGEFKLLCYSFGKGGACNRDQFLVSPAKLNWYSNLIHNRTYAPFNESRCYKINWLPPESWLWEVAVPVLCCSFSFLTLFESLPIRLTIITFRARRYRSRINKSTISCYCSSCSRLQQLASTILMSLPRSRRRRSVSHYTWCSFLAPPRCPACYLRAFWAGLA